MESSTVRDAIQLYEQRREKDIDAICRLMVTCYAPYSRANLLKYNMLWAGVIFRSILNNIAPFLFSQHYLSYMDQVPYSEVLRGAERSNTQFWAISVAAFGAALAYAAKQFR